MIQTDKYKKGIIALTYRAIELNPKLGYYKTHYLNKNAKFVIHFSNGQLEIDIELAREYEQFPALHATQKLHKAVFPYYDFDNAAKSPRTVHAAWKKLFSKQRKF